MRSGTINGAELLCRTLESLGVRHIFGVPGTQNILLYEALRRSRIRVVLSTHELGASFMANGYFRVSGRVAPLVTIPGPGFTYAMTGVAEALHDSAAVLHIVGQPASKPGKQYEFQSIDQETVAAPLVKRVFSIHEVQEIPGTVSKAYRLALAGEPGPVLLQWSKEALSGIPDRALDPHPRELSNDPTSYDFLVEEAAAFLGASRRPLLFAGQGAIGAAGLLQQLAERLASPVFTTSSGRGVLPEDHELALGFDMVRSEVGFLNEMIRSSDCILVLGCKLTSAGTGGFLVELPPERMIRIDASREVLDANYPARLTITASAESFLERLIPAVERRVPSPGGGWTREEVEGWKKRFRTIPDTAVPEPIIGGVTPATANTFFSTLRRVLPRNGILVTDSGLHQALVRRHFNVFSPRGLIMPNDFQSMGFGLPAAIGAKLASPERPVVVVIGDGGFTMSGMEILTAVREAIPLTVIVFHDGRLNLIRLEQFANFGRSESVDIMTPDFEAFSSAVGARYAFVDGNAEQVLQNAVRSDHVSVIEVFVGDSQGIHLLRTKGLARETARRFLGPGNARRVKAWMKRR